MTNGMVTNGMVTNSSARSVSLERAIAILEFLDASMHGGTLAQISSRLRIPRSTAHVLIVTLQRLGYVQQNAGGHLYSLGVKARILGCGTGACLQLGDRARPHLKDLTEAVGLASYVAVLDRDQALYVETFKGSDMPIDVYAGKRANLHCTAVGNVLLAGLRGDCLDNFLNNRSLMRHTSRTVQSAEELRARLQRVRKERYAFDDEEQALGVRCLAVPLLDGLRRVIGALGITGTTIQIREENIGFLLDCMKKTAERIAPAADTKTFSSPKAADALPLLPKTTPPAC
ncbi:MAG TPA: IclR family transcriptional regulator [Bryobacteraceae bacterium]|nr:IclR family transcriptional regulator [Bryobacteraceae bacterium]